MAPIKRLRPGCARGAVRAALFLAVAAALPCPAAEEDSFSVRMTGSARGTGAAARRLAVEDAQQQALTEAVKTMANTEDLAPFRMMLRQAAAYVPRHDLLRCDTTPDGQTHVEIDAHLAEKPLRQDIAAVMLPRLPRRPTVLVLLAERPEPGASPVTEGGPAAEALREGLEKFSFTVRGVDALQPRRTPEDLAAIVDGGLETGARFARENLHDVLLLGEASVTREPTTGGSNVYRHRGTVLLRVFSGTDGKMCDVFTAEGVVQGLDPAAAGSQVLSDAAARLVGDTAVSVTLAMLARQNRDRVIVTVEPDAVAGLTAAVAGLLGTAPGVTGVETLLDAPSLGRIALEYGGTMAALADFVHHPPAGGAALEVRRAVGREITIGPAAARE